MVKYLIAILVYVLFLELLFIRLKRAKSLNRFNTPKCYFNILRSMFLMLDFRDLLSIFKFCFDCGGTLYNFSSNFQSLYFLLILWYAKLDLHQYDLNHYLSLWYLATKHLLSRPIITIQVTLLWSVSLSQPRMTLPSFQLQLLGSCRNLHSWAYSTSHKLNTHFKFQITLFQIHRLLQKLEHSILYWVLQITIFRTPSI